jgi:hypothetical protein
MDEPSRARIRVFLNDPAARGQHAVSSEPPLETEQRPWGFLVEGKAPPARPYQPDTPEFLYWQIASALARGRALWSRLLPGAGTWVRGAVLPAIPVDGEDLNAFYDRKALHFFRDVNAKTGEIVQSGDSPDIVTHEQGHAVLDSIRPDLWDAPHFEIAAFHEGFGDLAAILVALDDTELARAALEETKGSLDHSNLVSRLAEELAAAVVAKYGPDAALPDALRDAVNSFSYLLPKSLPDEGPADALSREPHSFSRVVTGACWDALVRLSVAGNGSDRLAALQHASQAVGRLAASAAESTAPAASFFRRFATELRKAASGDDTTREAVTEALTARKLISAKDAAEPGTRPETRAAIGFEPEPLTTRVLDAIRERLGASRDEEILVRASRRDGSLSGRRIQDLVLSGPEYGPADGAAVEISDSFTVAVEESGYVTAASVESAGPEEEEDAREFVRTLARLDRIATDDDAALDTARMYKEGKSHFVSLERDGVRRLRRAWVAEGRS